MPAEHIANFVPDSTYRGRIAGTRTLNKELVTITKTTHNRMRQRLLQTLFQISSIFRFNFILNLL